MSAIKANIQNLDIERKPIVDSLCSCKRYEIYSNDVIEKVALEVVDRLSKSLLSRKNPKEIIFDDDELFDEIYDYMLKKLSEVFSTADIAYLVNDVYLQVEDILFDNNQAEFQN